MQLSTQEQFQAMVAGLEQTGMTLPQIASSVGCSRMHMWRIASGEVQSPRYDLAVKLLSLAEGRGVPALVK